MKVTNETIERYLRNELSSEELSEFTLQMVMNPNLRTEVEAMRMIFNTFRTTEVPTNTPSTSKAKLFFYLIIGFLSIGILGYFYFSKTTEKVEPQIKEAQINRPIATAFEPIEYFETFVTAQHRGVVSIDLSTPKNETMFELVNGKVNLNFTGNTKENVVLLTIWSNDLADFENDRPVFKQEIQVATTERFEFEKTLKLSEGLYYFTLNEEAYFGKFLVR